MCCAVGAVDRICFLFFTRTPGLHDLGGIIGQMAQIRRDAGGPILVVTILERGVTVPDAQTSREMMRLIKVVDQMVESHIVVIEGEGVVTKLVRGFVTAMAMVVVKPVTVAASLDAAIEQAARRLGLEPRTVLEAARTRGLAPAA